MELSIVIPCLNESETIAICVKKGLNWLEKFGVEGEVVVADNGSTDGSQDIIRDLGARLVEVPEKGYGNALRAGIAFAKGKYVIMGDADDSYDFSDLKPFMEKLREGNDLVMGCRMPFAGGRIEYGAMPWLHRWIGNPVLSQIGRILYNCPISDFHCGLRGFNRRRILDLNLKTTGMEFASEMIIRASLSNLKIVEVPITLYRDKRSRPPHLRTWSDGWRHLRFMLLYAPNWVFLVPAVSVGVVGAVLVFLTAKGPFPIGKTILDTNTLLIGCMLLITSFQLVLLGAFAKIFAIQQGFAPAPPNYFRIFKYFNLERGILFGLLNLIFGVTCSISVFLKWRAEDFGDLNYLSDHRLIILGVSTIVLGVHILLSSFFLSLLGLEVRQGSGNKTEIKD